MSDSIRIIEFNAVHQDAAAKLINTGLGERFGYVDESMNPDLFDIKSSYRKGDFLLAFDGDLLVGTGSLMPINEEVGQIARMHTAAEYRRRGVASRLLGALEKLAAVRGMRSLILETNLDWNDASAFYLSHGYSESERNLIEIHYRKIIGC